MQDEIFMGAIINVDSQLLESAFVQVEIERIEEERCNPDGRAIDASVGHLLDGLRSKVEQYLTIARPDFAQLIINGRGMAEREQDDSSKERLFAFAEDRHGSIRWTIPDSAYVDNGFTSRTDHGLGHDFDICLSYGRPTCHFDG